MPNPKRPSNPFTPSPEPDWVDVQRMGGRPEPPPARGSQRARTVDFNNPPSQRNDNQSQNPSARKLIVPAFPTHASQTANFDGSRDALNDLRRSESSASTRSLPTRPGGPGAFSSQPPVPPASRTGGSPQVLRKPAPPPIPNKKPALLSKNSSQSYRDEPAPRRSMASERKPMPNFMDEDGGAKPPLPPRTGTGLGNGSGRRSNLMDDEPEDMRDMSGWEVLQPQGGR
jgi:hypothetical protein